MASPVKKKKQVPMSKIKDDVKKVNGPPLDYTFMEIITFDEIINEGPRSGHRKPMENAENPDQKKTTKEAKDPSSPKKRDKGLVNKYGQKIVTCSLRISNNLLEKWDGFLEAMNGVLEEPMEMRWLDVSFNKLTDIDEVIATFPKLQVVYAHANEIKTFKDLKGLERLEEALNQQVDDHGEPMHIISITLHGNPIENIKGYRSRMIAMFPGLKHLDFGSITDLDRDKAEQLRGYMDRKKEERDRLRKGW